MNTALINIALAFLEGFALIISPCILPILPIILSGSLEGGKKRPVGIIVGFVLMFALFTFFSKQLVALSGVDLNLIRLISFGLLLLLGIIMVSSFLTEKFSRITQRLANVGSSLHIVNNPQGGFFSGILFGGLVGLIWTPCAGPILAAVIVQTVIQQTTLSSFFTVLFFGLGAAIPMLFIALLGRQILTKFSFLRDHAGLFRKILGVIIIISVLFMIAGDWFYAAVKQARQTTVMSEINLGYAQLKPFSSPVAVKKDQPGNYSYPVSLPNNSWSLKGAWIIHPAEIISNSANAAFKIHFYASQVSVVMASQSQQPIHIKLRLNGEQLISAKGTDVINSGLTVTNEKTYQVMQREYQASGVLEISADKPGLVIKKIIII